MFYIGIYSWERNKTYEINLNIINSVLNNVSHFMIYNLDVVNENLFFISYVCEFFFVDNNNLLAIQ